MARPQRSTKDSWLDVFADWDSDTQDQMLDVISLLHRQTLRRESKDKREPQPSEALLDGIGEGGHE